MAIKLQPLLDTPHFKLKDSWLIFLPASGSMRVRMCRCVLEVIRSEIAEEIRDMLLNPALAERSIASLMLEIVDKSLCV
ncbi:MAG: hypothetical protein MUC48_17965 [Leptolyngbya sp. Prado105]|jgi:hypothetical protein|nr:hypothetical protein [Leptolyngbya sp. Prado105]